MLILQILCSNAGRGRKHHGRITDEEQDERPTKPGRRSNIIHLTDALVKNDQTAELVRGMQEASRASASVLGGALVEAVKQLGSILNPNAAAASAAAEAAAAAKDAEIARLQAELADLRRLHDATHAAAGATQQG